MLTFLVIWLALTSAVHAGPLSDALRRPESRRALYLSWQRALPDPPPRQGSDSRIEPEYRFYADIHRQIAAVVQEKPGVVLPFKLGRTVEGRPIWAFRVIDPADDAASPPVTRTRLLVFAQVHPIEWVPAEAAADFLLDLAAHPVSGVEVVVVPVLNIDARLRVEGDLLAGRLDIYRRYNAGGVDLNRDFTTNRTSEAIWRHVIPRRYEVSPEPLSQPETKAIDALGAEDFSVVVSLHAFGGFFYYPWAGLWDRIPDEDRQRHVQLGTVMAAAQRGNAYKVKQLSHWGFFFRGLGMEVDHFYAQYGATSFLVEMTRSGLELRRPSTFRQDFRLYNPTHPAEYADQGTDALRALVHTLGTGILPGFAGGGRVMVDSD